MQKSIICTTRVRGFPFQDILILRALGNGVGQGARVVGKGSTASFLQVLGSVCKSEENRLVGKRIKE